jgi:hypothetical protein
MCVPHYLRSFDGSKLESVEVRLDDGSKCRAAMHDANLAKIIPRGFKALLVLFFIFATGCHSRPKDGTPVTESTKSSAAKRSAEPKILFTQVPERDAGNQTRQDVMEGTVSGAEPGQRLVLYSKTGNLWWLQPLLSAPFTPILPGGVWRNETHLGTDYAVLLVDPGYHPTSVFDQLPSTGRGIAAVAVTQGQEHSSSDFVDFSGFNWRVRQKPSNRGGTLNPYIPENVYVDKTGVLHLRIQERDHTWTASELNLTQSLGYGTYSFTLDDISKLDPSAAFAIFTWDYSTGHESNREFDITISQWGDPHDKNAEFVLQPTLAATNSARFTAPAGKLKLTIVWEAGRLTMIAARVLPSGEISVVSKHVFTSEVPTPGLESLRMTLFPYKKPNQKVFSLAGPAEVRIDHFEYLP